MTQTFSPAQAEVIERMEARREAGLEGKSPAFLAAYARAVCKASYNTLPQGASMRGGPGAGHGMPVSEQYLRGQYERQVKEESASWYDHDSSTLRYVQTPAGTVSAEADPLGYLRAHGFAAVDADGDEVMPSPGQARGLVRAYLDTMQRNAMSNQQGFTTVSFRDPQVRGPAALVHLRRIA